MSVGPPVTAQTLLRPAGSPDQPNRTLNGAASSAVSSRCTSKFELDMPPVAGFEL